MQTLGKFFNPKTRKLFIFWYWYWQCYCLLITRAVLMHMAQSQQQIPLSQIPQSQILSALESSGLLTASNINASAPTGNQFLLRFHHNDPKNNEAYVSITPVNYTNLNEPRIELRYQSKYSYVSLDERTPNNTVVAAVVVNDEDPGPNGETSLSIEHGNELNHFKLISTQFTNTIQVNGAPLSKHRTPEYNLTIVARDHGSPPKSSAVNLVIKLINNSNSIIQTNSAYNAPLDPQPSLKPPVTDFMFLGLMLVVIFSALILVLIIGCALIQRPKGKKGPLPRTTSSTATSRLHPSEHSQRLGHQYLGHTHTNF